MLLNKMATPLSVAAAEVALIAQAHAEHADRERGLARPVVDAIKAAGFPGHFVAPAYGGQGGDFAGFLDAVLTVSRGCAAAGWCASLWASHARMAGYLNERGRREIWADGPDALVCAGVVPSGTAEAVADGWLLSGRWKFVSGIDFADWVLLFSWDGSDGTRRLRVFAVPASDITIEDTWFTVGMRGTGSRTVVLEKAFVPAHRTFLQQSMLDGQADGPVAECHRVPFRLVNGLTMVAPALGAAGGALAQWSQWIAGKTEVAMGKVVPASGKASVRFAVTRSSAELDAAELLVRRIADVADAGGAVETDVVVRSHRDHAVAAELAVSSVDRIYRCSGASGQEEGNAIQRHWRDVNAAASHAALQFETAAGVYAGHVFG